MTEFLNPQQLVKQLDIQKGMKIADFGCGSGNITILLAKLVGKKGAIFAIDVLKSALESVESQAKVNNLNNIKTIRANLEVPSGSTLEQESVDFVLMANILFQSPNQKAIIQEAERVLKTGGRLALVDWLEVKTPYQTSSEEVKKLASLNFDREIQVGKYHFGLVFKKA